MCTWPKKGKLRQTKLSKNEEWQRMWHWICYLQHERPCSIGYIQDRGEGEILYIRYNSMCSSLRRKRTNPGCIAQIRVLESRRVLHNLYLILVGVKLRSILDEFWLGVKEDWGEWTPIRNTNLCAISQTDITGICSFAAQATNNLDSFKPSS